MIKVELKSGTQWVKRAMISTMGVTSINAPERFVELMSKPITEKSFRRMCFSRHSPIEEMEYWIEMIVPERVHTHLVRHKEIMKFVATSRPDLPWKTVIKNGERSMSCSVNLKRMIEISQQRLCNRAWNETKEVWKEIIQQVEELTPITKGLFHPVCVWYGVCPEGKDCCGYTSRLEFACKRNRFILDCKGEK